jgi:hypothetical protein
VHDIVVGLFNETVATAHTRGYLSGEHSMRQLKQLAQRIL